MWLLPSRGRPTSMTRFFKAWRDTGATTNGILCLDADDAPKYDAVLAEGIPATWRVIVRPRSVSLGANTNEYFEIFRNEPWYGLLADDAVPVTPLWDIRLIEAAGANGVACCHDGINNGKGLGSSPCIGGDLPRDLGWIIHPGLARIYGDNILYEIAEHRGVLRYLPEVVVEHWHFSTGKSPYDESYAKPESREDTAIYRAWKAAGGPAQHRGLNPEYYPKRVSA